MARHRRDREDDLVDALTLREEDDVLDDADDWNAVDAFVLLRPRVVEEAYGLVTVSVRARDLAHEHLARVAGADDEDATARGAALGILVGARGVERDLADSADAESQPADDEDAEREVHHQDGAWKRARLDEGPRSGDQDRRERGCLEQRQEVT